MAFEGGSSSAHIGGALSITDVMAVLMVMNNLPKKRSINFKQGPCLFSILCCVNANWKN